MPITLYELEGVRHGEFRIVPVEAEKATEHYVWFAGDTVRIRGSQRRSRDCYYRRIFDTEREALDFAIKAAHAELTAAESDLARAHKRVASAKALEHSSKGGER